MPQMAAKMAKDVLMRGFIALGTVAVKSQLSPKRSPAPSPAAIETFYQLSRHRSETRGE
jgi:hypothetical protein